MEEKLGHSTQKPIECMLRPIKNNSVRGEYVYDPFGGSGTTLIAAERSDRKCLMMEIDPRYCDMVIKRWQKETGKKAKLESTGQTFKEISEGAKPSE
jgi:DNA modification methylase